MSKKIIDNVKKNDISQTQCLGNNNIASLKNNFILIVQ